MYIHVLLISTAEHVIYSMFAFFQVRVSGWVPWAPPRDKTTKLAKLTKTNTGKQKNRKYRNRRLSRNRMSEKPKQTTRHKKEARTQQMTNTRQRVYVGEAFRDT